MKKKLLSIALIGFAFVASSQTTIFKEDFNSYAVGSNLSSDLTGATVGQGGWITTALLNGNNAATQLVQLSPNDNALQFTGYNLANTSPVSSSRSLSHTFDWLNRPTGQNFFNFEFVMQVGGITTSENNFTSYVLDQSGQILMGIRFDYKTREIFGLVYDEAYPATNPVTYAAGGVPLGKGFTKLIVGDDEQYIQIGMGYSVSDGDFYIGVRGLDKPALSGFMWASSAPLTGKQPYELKYFAIAGATNPKSASVIIDDITVKAQTCIFPNSAEFKYNSKSACIGTANLTPSRDVSYTGVFSSTPTGLSINATTGVIDMTTSLAGNYTVRYITDVSPADLQNGACSDFHTEQIEINPKSLPTATITGNSSFCSGSSSSVQLTAAVLSGASYEWTTGSSTILGTNYNYYATAAGSYKVKVTDSKGCSAVSEAKVITVNPLPTATITANGTTTFCQKSSVTLTASELSGASYEWKNGSSTLNNTTSSYTVTSTGNYTVKVTDDKGCSNTSTPKNVTVNSLPAATISVQTSGSGSSTCGGGSVTLTTPTLSGALYEWKNGSTTLINPSPIYSPLVAGSYTVTVTDVNQCSNISTPTTISSGSSGLVVTKTVTPEFSISACKGDVLAPSSLPTTSTNGIKGSWTVASNVYTFTANSNECLTTPSVMVPIIENPLPIVTITGNSYFCTGSSVQLTGSTISVASYEWTNGSSTLLGTNKNYSVTEAGSYKVKATDSNGCSAVSDPKVVIVNPFVVPTFAIKDVCKVSTAAELSLSTSSTNGITGIWTTSASNAVVTSIDNSTVGSTKYTFTPSSSMCATIYNQTINVSKCAGIEEAIVSPFTIYPNPSNDVISISFSELTSRNGTIRFFSAEGKLIESREYNNSPVETFDVKSLNSGVYFFQIGNTTEKVIIK